MNEHSRHSAAMAAPTTPAGGRRGAAREVLRTRLLDAAETLIADRQASAITARDIARRAEASDGVLYNHFADKHELLLAALVRRFEHLVGTFHAEVAAIDADAAAQPDLERDVTRLAEASFRLQAAALPMVANVLSEPALFHRFMAAIHRPPLGGHVFHAPFEAQARTSAAAGRAAAVPPHAVADLMVGAVLLLAIVDLVGGRPREESEARVAAAARTLVAGLAPRS